MTKTNSMLALIYHLMYAARSINRSTEEWENISTSSHTTRLIMYTTIYLKGSNRVKTYSLFISFKSAYMSITFSLKLYLNYKA